LRVTVHAGLGSGNIRVGRFFNARMAVATIHPELVDMKRVIKCGGLGRLVSHPSVFRREVVGHA